MIKGIVGIALVVALGSAALIWHQTRPRPQNVSGILEADEIRLGSHVGGRVAETLVQQGSEVEAGAVLVRLDPFNLLEQLQEAEAQRATAQAGLTKLRAGFRLEERAQARAKRDGARATLEETTAGPRKEELEQAEETYREAQAQLVAARQHHARTQALLAEESTVLREMEEATSRLDVAQARAKGREANLAMLRSGARKEQIAQGEARLQQAEAELRMLEAGARPEDIQEATARVLAWTARIDAIRKQIKELEIVAPSRGTVEAIDLHPGDIVTPNAPVITLVDRRRYWVRAYLPETALSMARLNASVKLTIDGFPGRVFTGRVAFVALQPEFTPNNVQTPETRGLQVYRIRVSLNEESKALRPGMAADLSFDGADD